MALLLRSAARSHPGLVREGNEDSGFAGSRLLVVADGMGGHVAGEVASAIAATTMSRIQTEPASGDDLLGRLTDAVDQANDQLRLLVTGDPALRGMGTTLTALFYEGARLGLVHVGDSRAYLLRDGSLHQITHDHTFVQSLIDEGRISVEQAEVHPQRSLITRALDGRDEIESDVSLREALAGDRYLLCSDGLSGVVREETLERTLREIADREAACDALIDLALKGGGPDNITCIVADIVDADADAGDTGVGFVGAAAREARAASGRPEGAGEVSGSSEGAPLAVEADPRGRRPWLWVLAVLVLIGIVGTAYTAYASTQRQYYVAADPAGNVAIYRGVPSEVLGVSLSSLEEAQDLPLTSLPAYNQDRVNDNIEASGLDDARRIVANLREAARACAAVPTPIPTPTPTPTRTPTPAVSPRPSATPNAARTPAPTPTRSVVPSPGVPRLPFGCDGATP